jgi:hypothetical protein
MLLSLRHLSQPQPCHIVYVRFLRYENRFAPRLHFENTDLKVGFFEKLQLRELAVGYGSGRYSSFQHLIEQIHNVSISTQEPHL